MSNNMGQVYNPRGFLETTVGSCLWVIYLSLFTTTYHYIQHVLLFLETFTVFLKILGVIFVNFIKVFNFKEQ